MIYYSYAKDDRILTERDVMAAGGGGNGGVNLPLAGLPSDGSERGPLPPGAVGFESIGIGRPLTISIREVYTGQYPVWNLFGGKKDMLVTSAIKSIATYEAKPLALNFLTKKVSSQTRMERPQASREGTPIVFYSPALTERSLTLDLTIVFDQFPADLFEGVANAFESAAKIPVFFTSGSYLIAAGAIARLAGQLGEWFLDGQPSFEASEAINIDWAGTVPAAPGFALITARDLDRHDPTFRDRHRIVNGTLVNSASGARYAGDIPYIIISLDGREDPGLASFLPTAASAAMLSRFFGIKDGQSKPLDYLVDAIKVYSDFHFRQEADRIDRELAGLDATTDEGKKQQKELLAKRQTFVKNIGKDELRPPILRADA